ncbi:hypothetical protein Tco_1044148 [Tanacetum coccineum]|uniref:Uncharacterized protein n=1 Tax=Tanacetum coccineum TaxID=301880 RepID=A0ABQ5GRP3_9ASTR
MNHFAFDYYSSSISMAGSGPFNVIARLVIDEIFEFNGETETPKYMKVFISQEIAEARHFIRVQREEAQAVRSSLAQVRPMVAEMEAVNDLDEYYDSLRCLRESWRIGEDKPRGLNETIVVAEMRLAHWNYIWRSWMLQSIPTTEVKVKLSNRSGTLSGMANGVSVLFCIILWLMDCLKVAQLSVVHDMHRLSQCTPMRPLSFRQRISLSKKHRLVAELEALGEREGAAKPFEHMKEIVARDTVTLGELETLLARSQVGVSLKAGFVADMEERE